VQQHNLVQMEDFPKWLAKEIKRRGWRQAEFARRAGLSPSQVSRVLTGEPAGHDFCQGAAQAMGFPPPLVFRLAGLLPSYPVADESRARFMEIWDYLDQPDRDSLTKIAESLLYRRSLLNENSMSNES
jgi:transcriptional regulator with XRE-family HTH domain